MILINALSATNRSSRNVLTSWLRSNQSTGQPVHVILRDEVESEFEWWPHRTVVRGLQGAWWLRRVWESRQIPRIARRIEATRVVQFGGFPLRDLDVPQTAYLHNPIPFLKRTWEAPESRIKPVVQLAAYRSLLRFADRYQVPSQWMRDLVRSRVAGLAPDDFDVVPHELADDLVGLQHEPADSDALILVTAGCWAPHKDLQATFRLLRDLRDKRCLNVRPVVIGEWANEPYRQYVMTHPSLEAVRSNVQFTGFLPRPEYLELIRTAHLYVTTSRSESFGIPVHEAEALQVPVLDSSKFRQYFHRGPSVLGADPFKPRDIDARSD